MLDDENPSTETSTPVEPTAAPDSSGASTGRPLRTRRRAASRPAGPPPAPASAPLSSPPPGGEHDVASPAEPVATTSEPVATASEPVATTSEPVATASEPVATAGEPVATAGEPRAITAVSPAASDEQPGEEPVTVPSHQQQGGQLRDAPVADETSAAPTQEPPAKSSRRRRAPKAVAEFRGPIASPGPDPAPTEELPTAADREPVDSAAGDALAVASAAADTAPVALLAADPESGDAAAAAPPVALLFQPPEPPPAATRAAGTAAQAVGDLSLDADSSVSEPDPTAAVPGRDASAAEGDADGEPESSGGERTSNRRRRSRGGRNRRKSSGGAGAPEGDTPTASAVAVPGNAEPTADDAAGDATDAGASGAGVATAEAPAEPIDTDESSSSSRRRRRRRRGGEADGADESAAPTDKSTRKKPDSITNVEGSTRVEAKKQRRREGRDAGRRRAPILSESEFLARRESVDRVMAIRQHGGITQIAVLEDGVLVEHYVALESQTSLIGNVYLGRVQNVLPSMEAAFVDIGKGRNAVLYAGEVDWALRGDLNQPRRIENALKAGQTVLVQVTKDPVGHKGARLTSQISLPGRYLVYVPAGGTNGISRKLPDTERSRLKSVLKDIVPDEAGVIIRTAAEGASEDELKRDVARLTARWDDIEKKTKSGQAPQLLYGEPDTTIKVVRDLFTEDFTKLVVSGDDAWDMVDGYVSHVAPDLAERLERYPDDATDVFEEYRVEEQIAKALERKVWLPSGGSLVIDRTEAMTVVDVNTGKFTGAGGNLEQTVTKNNLEAAEEIVRQLRLRDIGGIIVIDFIDMVLEDNRDLVLRRLVECLGRDRTRHQVAEVTSLGLVQMTRKRISTGLLEAFSTNCEHCHGRGVVIRPEPVVAEERSSSNGAGRGNGAKPTGESKAKPKAKPKIDEMVEAPN